jgi:large subunit ribosomal protein L18
MITTKHTKRQSRHNRIRAKISGTADKPRLAVFKSNKFIYAQLIDDVKGETLAQADSKKNASKTQTEQAIEVGKVIAEAAKEKKIVEVVFDRGGFRYAGNIKALADSAREAGLKF